MGYESRVYIVQEFDDGIVWENGMRSAQIIAKFNLCCVEEEVLNAFKSKAECCLIENDEFITTDCYGDELKCADIMTLYNAIEYGKYWRTTALKEYLHGIINTKENVTFGFGGLKAYHHERTWDDHMGNTPCGYYTNVPLGNGKTKRVYIHY